MEVQGRYRGARITGMQCDTGSPNIRESKFQRRTYVHWSPGHHRCKTSEGKLFQNIQLIFDGTWISTKVGKYRGHRSRTLSRRDMPLQAGPMVSEQERFQTETLFIHKLVSSKTRPL